jgi:hypothetical protein
MLKEWELSQSDGRMEDCFDQGCLVCSWNEEKYDECMKKGLSVTIKDILLKLYAYDQKLIMQFKQ